MFDPGHLAVALVEPCRREPVRKGCACHRHVIVWSYSIALVDGPSSRSCPSCGFSKIQENAAFYGNRGVALTEEAHAPTRIVSGLGPIGQRIGVGTLMIGLFAIGENLIGMREGLDGRAGSGS